MSLEIKEFYIHNFATASTLYMSPILGAELSQEKWKKIESIQKHFLIKELGVRLYTPHPILLAEAIMLILEAEALCHCINTLDI